MSQDSSRSHRPMVITEAVNELIVGLHRYGREVPMEEFQRWAFERLREAVAFDSGMWREGGDAAPLADSVYLLGQPRGLLDEYLRDGWYAKDFLRERCAEAPGTTFGITDVVTAERWRRTPLYRRFVRRFGIEWALSTHRIEPNWHLKSVITIWRSDPERPFAEEERLRKQVLVPHLVEAMRANRLWHFAAGARLSARGDGAAMAVCDSHGLLHDTGRNFAALIRSEWAGWSGAVLPSALVERLGQGRLIGRRIDVDSAPLGDRWLLSAQAGGAAKRLGAHELQAARLYAQGLTYREIAGQLGVAPATVRNQLRSSFAKLGVNSKVELARRLAGSGSG